MNIKPTHSNMPSELLTGMIGGTLLSIFGTLRSEDIINTVILAAIGAATSFVVSFAMKWIFRGSKNDPP